MSEVAVIVQARSGSSRLPGKVLEHVGSCPLLVHVVRRAEQAGYPVLVAPPGDDEPVYSLCHEHGIHVPATGFGGEEGDVLGRFAHAWQTELLGAEVLVRVTGDCPLLDWRQIQLAVHAVQVCGADYATNATMHLPVDGWDVEAFSWELLGEAHHEAASAYDREHVTPWMRRHADAKFYFNYALEAALQHRWTVDTAEDLAWLRKLHAALGNPAPPGPDAPTLLRFLGGRPSLQRYSTDARS